MPRVSVDIRRGTHDLNFLTFGYGGKGPRCLRYFFEGVGEGYRVVATGRYMQMVMAILLGCLTLLKLQAGTVK